MQKFSPALERGPLPLRPIRSAQTAIEPAIGAPAVSGTAAAIAAASALPTRLPHHARRDAARRGLLDLLDSVRGRKALVLEACFAAPLGLIADALTLKEHGVEV
jgi:hypothetical protein